VVRITERDFHLAASVKQVAAGPVRISVHNRGPDDHELIIIRQPAGHARLPMRTDGVTLDEDKLAPVTVGSGLPPGRPGGVRYLSVRLTPGRYMVLCNMAGHYLGGMHTELRVQ
jgi:uncharacterized cupredoxin-like copper-binding protein